MQFFFSPAFRRRSVSKYGTSGSVMSSRREKIYCIVHNLNLAGKERLPIPSFQNAPRHASRFDASRFDEVEHPRERYGGARVPTKGNNFHRLMERQEL
jgi:hypothetical protein